MGILGYQGLTFTRPIHHIKKVGRKPPAPVCLNPPPEDHVGAEDRAVPSVLVGLTWLSAISGYRRWKLLK